MGKRDCVNAERTNEKKSVKKIKWGLFDGKYEIPDDFDDEDDEILKLMGVNEESDTDS